MGSPYGLDRLFGSIPIITGVNDDLIVDTGSGDQTFQMPALDYYAYAGGPPLVGGVSLPSIYIEMLPVVGAGFTVSFATPTVSTTSPVGGVTVDGITIRLSQMHPSWRPLFGVLESDTTTDVTGLVSPWTSPYSVGYQTVMPRHAVTKLADVVHEQYRSGNPNARYQYRWGTEETRTLVYDCVPAALVRSTRAGEAQAWADAAGLALGDVNPTWASVWESASRGLPMIVVHNEGDQDLGVLTHPYEVVRLAPEQQDRFSATWVELDEAGEFYTLSLPVDILTSTYSHA